MCLGFLSADSPPTTKATTTHPDRVASAIDSDEPFMLGDYMEKGHFFASTSMIRNEVLECVRFSELDNNNDLVAKTECEGSKKKPQAGDDRVVFRCIHCKGNKDRADMSAIRPKVRMYDALFCIHVVCYIMCTHLMSMNIFGIFQYLSSHIHCNQCLQVSCTHSIDTCCNVITFIYTYHGHLTRLVSFRTLSLHTTK